MQQPAVFDAHSIHNAIRGLGTNDRALIEVLCTRTNQQIKAIKEAYKKGMQCKMLLFGVLEMVWK